MEIESGRHVYLEIEYYMYGKKKPEWEYLYSSFSEQPIYIIVYAALFEKKRFFLYYY
jgi:hypothetical protein